MKVDQNTCLVMMYVGPLRGGEILEEIMSKLERGSKNRIITTSDIKAGQTTWDKLTSPKEKAIFKIATRRNYNISPHRCPSATVRGRNGNGKPYLLLDVEKQQSPNRATSDRRNRLTTHPAKQSERRKHQKTARISKSMVTNIRNIEKVVE